MAEVSFTRSRLPPWFTLPIALTSLRIALLPCLVVVLVTDPPHHAVAIGILAVMAATDVLDGPIARRTGQVSRLGTILDPTADKLLVNLAIVLLALPSVAPAGFCIPVALVAGVYLKDAGVLIGVAVVYGRVGRVGIAAARHGKLSTLSQLLLIFVALCGPVLSRFSSNMAGTLLWMAEWATLLATAYAGVGYSLEGARQLRADAQSTERTFHDAEAEQRIA